VADNVASFNGTTGKLIKDGGVALSSLAVGPASAVADNVASFNGTTGKLIKDGGVALSALAPLAGPAFTGTPTAPTPAAGTNNTRIATAAFVNTAILGTSAATVTAGTNAQGQGALTTDYNVVTTAAANPSGVTLPTATVGRVVDVVNKGANPIAIYPATGAQIDALGSNVAVQIPIGGFIRFRAISTTQWYSSNTGSFSTDASGNVGIGGPPTLSGKLEIFGTSGQTQLKAGYLSNSYLMVTAYDSNPVYCVVSGSTATAGVFGTQTNIPLVFFTNNTDRGRFDTGGNLGVGIAPSHRLHVFRPSSDAAATISRIENGATNQDVYSSYANAANSNAEFLVGLAGTGSQAYVWDRAARSIIFGTNNAQKAYLDTTGNFVLTSAGGLGYGTGSGGSVTQLTSKTTGVTLNKASLQITMNAAALAASTTVVFALTNTVIASTDSIVVAVAFGATSNGNYQCWGSCSAGSANIYVRNISGGSLSEAIVLNCLVIKGSNS
jgi:hypothetical protein